MSVNSGEDQFLLPDVHTCWTFLEDHRIPLTNNFAERAIRPYVIWRKLSYSTQSDAGNQFRPMIFKFNPDATIAGEFHL